jgi:phosphate starvation-inducible PhoH-like protein
MDNIADKLSLTLRSSKKDSVPATKEKKPRKARKQNEKELLQQYFFEESLENATTSLIHYSSSTPTIHKPEDKFTKPKNHNQERLVEYLKDKTKKIIFVTGPAGTGKTLFATEQGVHQFLTGTYEKLVFTRPNVSVDEELGFLPGTLEEKLGPYVRPIYDILYQFVSPKEVQTLMDDKSIEIAPLGFMRGRTFKNTWIVADEMQNSTESQMKMLLTRLGENSRLIITGDLEQSDIYSNVNGLQNFLNRFGETQSESIVTIRFHTKDILREAVVQEILNIYQDTI